MEKDKADIKAFVAEKGKSAAGLIERAKQKVVGSLDQNDDGKLSVSDIAHLADQMSEKKEQAKSEAERRTLRPIFEDDLNNADFLMTRLIRITPMDKKHAESTVCDGSIGYESDHKGLHVINIYPDKADAFELTFYPDAESEVYYVDPSDRDHYIALEKYFAYLKTARVSELQRIAQDLGATHFKVTYIEATKTESAKQAKGKLGAKMPGGQSADGNYSHNDIHNSHTKVRIEAEMECIGHAPKEPVLEYFKKDPQIRSLVALRMSDNTLKRQTYTLDMSISSGMKAQDAAKIDAALGTMKLDQAINIQQEATSESHRFFEYEIDF